MSTDTMPSAEVVFDTLFAYQRSAALKSAIDLEVFTAVIASALGGYITGRLRRFWHNTHRDEVVFRDHAHGLVTWAVATLSPSMLNTR